MNASRNDYILELLVEEIPAGVIRATLETICARADAGLAAAGLPCEEVRALATSRRLILWLRGLAAMQPDRQETMTGPPKSSAYDADGALTGAARGYAKSQGIAVEELRVVETPKGEYVGYSKSIAGRSAEEILPSILTPIFAALTFPRMMRWGDGAHTFVRPLHSMVSLYGEREVPIQLFGVSSGRRTEGHRILGAREIKLASAADYSETLAREWVEIDGTERCARLGSRLAELAGEVGGEAREDEELLATLANLVEWPGLVRGEFPRRFLDLPEEILVTTMKTHQKQFPIHATGPGNPLPGLLPYFVAVMDNRDDPKGLIRQGNEWVLTARLADAEFFYRADRARRLADLLPSLAHLSFHERLGDYRQKAGRLQDLSEFIANALGHPEVVGDVLAAAKLCKADLVTGMVKEFPELEGIVGGIYARQEGLPEGVWMAIYDHYLPKALSDRTPRSLAAQIVALADRIDTLVGMFGLGLVPSGSKDPYGSRRHAQGVVRIVLEGRLDLDLDLVLAKAIRLYDEMVSEQPAAVLESLRAFFRERVRFVLEKQGFLYDEILAVLEVASGNIIDVRRRVAALAAMREIPEFLALARASKRIRNIIGATPVATPDPKLFALDAERALYGALMQAKDTIDDFIRNHDYLEALKHISSLGSVLDRFFADVLVMDEDERVRDNRLALLSAVNGQFVKLAQFSALVVEKAAYLAERRPTP